MYLEFLERQNMFYSHKKILYQDFVINEKFDIIRFPQGEFIEFF
jgi:hypothetical protein